MQKKASRHMLILMVIYLVVFSQRWDETISFFPKKCIITRLFLRYLFFENFHDNYDKKTVVCPTVAVQYLWNGLMNFSEILNFSSRDKKKKARKNQDNLSSRLGAVRAGLMLIKIFVHPKPCNFVL
jgi:hypothetical protein